jgi:L-2-hydroxyglutarate oxidase LhgO
MQGMETLVFERHARPGAETTSRNSGVIHSGIYYPAGSLKATLCVQGRELLYSFCEARGIAHQRCGKIVVAGESQVGALDALYKRGIGNGVVDLELLDRSQVAQLEPAVACAAGLLSPSTGIIDVHELLLALLGRRARLHCGSGPRRVVLCGNPRILAGHSSGLAAAGIRWRAPEAGGAGGGSGRF